MYVRYTGGAIAMLHPAAARAEYQLPYEGAKEMFLMENVEDGDFLNKLFKGNVRGTT